MVSASLDAASSGWMDGLDVVVAAPPIRNADVISVQSASVSLQMITNELREWVLRVGIGSCIKFIRPNLVVSFPLRKV